MNELKLNPNVEEYSINGGAVVLRFNPFDSGFIERFNDAFKDLSETQDEFAKAASLDDEAFFQTANATDKKMRGVLNELFGEDICTPIWGNMHVTALSEGLPLWFNLMMALIDEIDNSRKNVPTVRSARLDKYTAKYLKK